MAGHVRKGAELRAELDFGVQLNYDPPPEHLTVGQLARTYCGDTSLLIAKLRPPPEEGLHYVRSVFNITQEFCLSPYDIPSDALPPATPEESSALWSMGKNAQSTEMVTGRFITASEWQVDQDECILEADIQEVLDEHGAGVYTVCMWARVGWDLTVVSTYPVFHDVELPEGYD